ncbi:MAG: DUF4157 domain-containing protein [Nostoc sp.]|uniref:eCIS core domain-containing protein n=1 Tax=Nostoc sp. TaxID=1180 RepID=UPI002FFBABD1
MGEHVGQHKKATTGSFSIPTLKQPTRGFGLNLGASSQVATEVQLKKPLGHDISRISLRSQTKLTVNQPGDVYEQEADKVAQQVMQRQSIQREALPEEDEELQMKSLSNANIPSLQREALPEEDEELQMKSLSNANIPSLQREALPEEDEELQMKSLSNANIPSLQREALPEEDEELQMKPQAVGMQFLNKPLTHDISRMSLRLQTKLTVNQPGDVYEQEADKVAQQVMQRQSIQREALPEEEEELQMKSVAGSITPVVQRKGGGIAATSDLETSIQKERGSGQPLADDVRQPMEQAFGTNFGGVKIHTDSQSDQLNQSIQARAFTTGQDIFFRQGEYAPESHGGKELLAHELTHVVQQTGKVQPKSNTFLERKENKLQTKVDSAQSSVEAKIQLKENPQGQPTTQGSLPVTKADVASPTGDFKSGGMQDKPNSPSAAPLVSAGSATGAPSGGTGSGATVGGSNGTADVAASSSASLEKDPEFQAVVNQAKVIAENKKKHDPAQAESKEAQDAAEPPSNEVESKAKDKQVQEMNQQQSGAFNAAAFKAALMQKIAAVIPNNEKDAEKFKESNKIDSVKQDMSSQVNQEQEQAAGPIENKIKEAPNTSGIEPKPVTPLQQPKADSSPTNIDAEKAAPKPKPESEVSQPLKANSQELDQQMAEARVTEEQLGKSNEPQFQEAIGAKKEAQVHAVEAPKAYRQDEQATINKGQAQAQATSQSQLEGMHGQREQLLAQVMGVQGQTQSKDTQERAKIASEVNGIYENTKKAVETVLDGIDGDVTSKFDAGAVTAKQKFETHVGQKMDAWNQQRYGEWYDVTGWDERISDAWHGLPPEVNQFFVDGRQLYLDSMDVTLTEIAKFVAQKLNEAKQKISDGQQKIHEYVAGLPENLRKVGQEAAQNIQGKFDQLEESINSKQDQLIDSLAQKYSENLQQIDAEIEKKKEENRGLKDKAKDAIAGTIQTIIQLKDMLMGVLAKAAGAIDKIILDPIAFLGNLVAGIKQGFDKFAGNIENHLKKGLIGWLTGAMAGAGIQMPENFDLKGIFSLVMQVLGLVYDGIKSRVIKALGKNGEKIFTALETSFEMFVILKNEGIAGLWQFIQDKIGDLKVMVMDTIQTFVIENVIKAGVIWVVSLLNPASAFVKACKAIYDIIMFFIERGSQIVELVNAVTDSVSAIASGAIGGAAALIENALGTALPVVISFMASLLGLGGISEKIGEIIQKVRQPIDKAIDWLIAKAVQFAKKLGFGKDKDNKEEDPEHDSKVAKGLKQIDDEEALYTKNSGKITRKDAEKVAAKVKSENPIFESITVIDGGDTWDYKYVASEGKKKGEEKTNEQGTDENNVKQQISDLQTRALKVSGKIDHLPDNNTSKLDLKFQLKEIQDNLETAKQLSKELQTSSDSDHTSLEQLVKEERAKLTKLEESLEKDKDSEKSPAQKVKEILDSGKAQHILPASYSGGKHWKGSSEKQRRENSMNKGPGQFLCSMTSDQVKQLEKDTLLTGRLEDKSQATYHAYKTYGEAIGYANGDMAHELRAELTAAESDRPAIHSHPHS